jgi:hypothetical protein
MEMTLRVTVLVGVNDLFTLTCLNVFILFAVYLVDVLPIYYVLGLSILVWNQRMTMMYNLSPTVYIMYRIDCCYVVEK